MVPPRRRMPVTSLAESTRDRFGSISPSKLSSRPTTSMPSLTPALTTARITAFRPGASPPPVRIPIRFSFCMQSGYSGGPSAGLYLRGPVAGNAACRRAGHGQGCRRVYNAPDPLPPREGAWYCWRSCCRAPAWQTDCRRAELRFGRDLHQALNGRLAQLGERRVRNAEVGSSSLLPSTKILLANDDLRPSLLWSYVLLALTFAVTSSPQSDVVKKSRDSDPITLRGC